MRARQEERYKERGGTARTANDEIGLNNTLKGCELDFMRLQFQQQTKQIVRELP
jgi:hypothetical protein